MHATVQRSAVLSSQQGPCGRRAAVPATRRTRPPRAISSSGSAGNSNEPVSNVGTVAQVMQQHRLLLEAGFSYDQAALMLELVERQRQGNQQQALPARAPAVGATSHTQELQQQQQPSAASPSPLAAFEQRLSFVEMELLKQSFAAVPAAAADAASAGAAAPALSPHQQLRQLDPQVAAVAEALAVRQGLPLAPLLWEEQQQQRAPAEQPQPQPVSIWGRRAAARRQLAAKPWRYTDQQGALPPAARRRGGGGIGSSSGVPGMWGAGAYRSDGMLDDELVPYEPHEPSAGSIVGVVMVVYLGVLLTLVSLVTDV